MTDTVQPEAEAVAALNHQIEQLQLALETRDVIGQAKGILMERFRITAEEAFDRLRTAIASRDLIGQAKGILMERFRITSDQAFRVLVGASSRTNRKVNALAAELAGTGEWPVPGPPS